MRSMAFLLLFWLGLGHPAWAAQSGAPSAEDVCRPASEAVISAQSQWGSQAAKVSEDIIAPSRNVYNTDCLSKLTYGIKYSISSIFQGLNLKKMICRALQSAVQKYSSSIHYSASLPYGLLGIEVGANANAGIEGGGGSGDRLFGSGIMITDYDQQRIDTGSVLQTIYSAGQSAGQGVSQGVSIGTQGGQGGGATPFAAGGGR